MYTYIMKHNIINKYYCGKTNNINRRMKEHKTDRRSNYYLIYSIEGDYEKSIKKFGVKRFIKCVLSPEVKQC